MENNFPAVTFPEFFCCVTRSATISLAAKIPKRCMISLLLKMDYGKPVNEPPRGRTRKGAGAVALTGLNRNDLVVTYQY